MLHATTLQIVLALLAGGVGLPVPEELVLLVAGWRLSRGEVTLAHLLPLALGAIVASDLMLYGIGRLAGAHPRIARWLLRPSIDRFSRAYLRHGIKLVLLARVAIGARAPLFLAAGMARVPLRRFVLVDALGAAVLSCLWMSLGAWLGPRLATLTPHLHTVGCGALTVVIGVVLWKARRSKARTTRPASGLRSIARLKLP